MHFRTFMDMPDVEGTIMNHPYVKDDRSTVQMVLFRFSGTLPRRAEGRFYRHRPNPQGRQSLHVDQATGTAVNKEGYSEWLAILGLPFQRLFMPPGLFKPNGSRLWA